MSADIPPDERQSRELTATVAPEKSPHLEVDESHPGCCVLRLARPDRKNALDRELLLDLIDAVEHAGRQRGIATVVITGKGGAFCSGADLSAITGVSNDQFPERIAEFHRLIRALIGLTKPVIAAVTGPAVGFGADMTLACDIRVLSEDAYMEPSFSKVGLMPDGGGTFFWPKYLGARAFEVLALGSRIEAGECARVGIANRVVPEAEVLAQALELADRLRKAPPLAIQQIKHAVRSGQQEQLFQALYREARGQAQLLGSRDFQEGVRAFMEKRPAKFEGQ